MKIFYHPQQEKENSNAASKGEILTRKCFNSIFYSTYSARPDVYANILSQAHERFVSDLLQMQIPNCTSNIQIYKYTHDCFVIWT